MKLKPESLIATHTHLHDLWTLSSHLYPQTCAASVHLSAQCGVRLWSSGLRHPIQPPALLWLPGAAGGAGCADSYCDTGAWWRGSPPTCFPFQHRGARGMTAPMAPQKNQSNHCVAYIHDFHKYFYDIFLCRWQALKTCLSIICQGFTERRYAEYLYKSQWYSLLIHPRLNFNSIFRILTLYWRALHVCWPTLWLRLTFLTLPRRSSSIKSCWCFSGSFVTSIRLE